MSSGQYLVAGPAECADPVEALELVSSRMSSGTLHWRTPEAWHCRPSVWVLECLGRSSDWRQSVYVHHSFGCGWSNPWQVLADPGKFLPFSALWKDPHMIRNAALGRLVIVSARGAYRFMLAVASIDFVWPCQILADLVKNNCRFQEKAFARFCPRRVP